MARLWWTWWPDANIAIACGPESIEVLDFDVKNDNPGGDTYKNLKAAGLLDGAFAVVRTPSGGFHLYYPPSPSGQPSGAVNGFGLDMQGAGKYVLAPPSVIFGESYSVALSRSRFSPKVHPVDFAAIRSYLSPAPVATRAPRVSHPRQVGLPRPGDDFNERADWGDALLLGGAGWRLTGHRGRQLRWCRPGKAGGISAVTGGDLGDCLYVYTSSDAYFVRDTSYSKFGAYALLHHGGDHKAAASELRRLGYGTMRAVEMEGAA
jgi:hypothetical protein